MDARVNSCGFTFTVVLLTESYIPYQTYKPYLSASRRTTSEFPHLDLPPFSRHIFVKITQSIL